MIADRGFQDANSLWTLHVPESKEKGKQQMSTRSANQARMVSVARVGLERGHGCIKSRYPSLMHTQSTTTIDYALEKLRALLSIENFMGVKVIVNSEENITYMNTLNAKFATPALALATNTNWLKYDLNCMFENPECGWIPITIEQMIDRELVRFIPDEEMIRLNRGEARLDKAKLYVSHVGRNLKFHFCSEDCSYIMVDNVIREYSRIGATKETYYQGFVLLIYGLKIESLVMERNFRWILPLLI